MHRLLSLAALGAALAAPAWAQVRVELGAPARAPSVLAAPAPAGPAAPAFAAGLAPAAPGSAAPLAAPAAPALATPLSAAAVPVRPAASVPDAAPRNEARAPAAEPRTPAAPPKAAAEPTPKAWDFARWREGFATEDAAGWRFREPRLSAARLFDGLSEKKPLGEGAMGAVFVHPWDSDKVVKVARRGYADAAGEYMADDETVLAYEDFDLARLAAVGAAPRPLARLTISGRPASLRERVRGFTVAELKRRGLFGARESALVRELLERVAEAGFVARDLNLGNLMIGRVGGARDRAWIVDTLGVAVRDDLDAAGRKAEMLAAPVPWIAVQGFGLGRPLSKALDASEPRLGDAPIAWPRWRRWTTLGGILAALAFVPAAAHATLSAPFGLGVLPSWPVLAGVAALLGLAGIPLRLFAHRLAPWVMTRGRDLGADLARRGPLSAIPDLVVGAAVEEAVFRGILFALGVALLHALMPLAPALAAASFLSSLVFALVHGYGSVWTRVVGGMIYAGAFAASGTLLLPIAAHFAFNLALYVHARYLS